MGEYLELEQELDFGRKVQNMYAHLEDVKNNNVPENPIIIQEGKHAVEELFRSHHKMVWKEARNMKAKHPSSLPLEDLAQEGMAGLMVAIKKYDPSRGNRLSTVAHHWIYQSIARSNNSNSRLVRIPENKIGQLRQIRDAYDSYKDKGMSQSEMDKAVMKDVGIRKEYFYATLNAVNSPLSLDKTFGDDDSTEFSDFAEIGVAESSEDYVLRGDVEGSLLSFVLQLPEMNRDVMLASCGFADSDKIDFSLTPHKVRQKYKISTDQYDKVMAQSAAMLRSAVEKSGYVASDF